MEEIIITVTRPVLDVTCFPQTRYFAKRTGKNITVFDKEYWIAEDGMRMVSLNPRADKRYKTMYVDRRVDDTRKFASGLEDVRFQSRQV